MNCSSQAQTLIHVFHFYLDIAVTLLYQGKPALSHQLVLKRTSNFRKTHENLQKKVLCLHNEFLYNLRYKDLKMCFKAQKTLSFHSFFHVHSYKKNMDDWR